MPEYNVGFHIRGTIKVEADEWREVVDAVSAVMRQVLGTPDVGNALGEQSVRMRAFPEVTSIDIIPASAMMPPSLSTKGVRP